MIVCKSPAEIEKMRAANQLVAKVLEDLAALVAPGVTTSDLDAAAEARVRAAGAEPAFKGYRGYPATLCASVNEQVVHGIPNRRALASGDIVSLGEKIEALVLQKEDKEGRLILSKKRAQYERALTADPSSSTAKKGLQELNALQARVDRPAPGQAGSAPRQLSN